MLLFATLIIALSVTAIKHTANAQDYDGVVACGDNAQGSTTVRHQRFGNHAPDAVYVLNVNQASTVTVNSCDSDFDTWLRIMDIDGTEEICGCDDCGDCGVQTVLDCELGAGHYLLIVDGYATSSGSFDIDVACAPYPVECGGSTAGYTNGLPSLVGNPAADAFYDFTIYSATTVTVSSCGSGFDTWLRVLSPDLATEFCNCDDCGDCGVQTVLECVLDAGHYKIAVDGYSSSEGDFELTLQCAAAVMECGEVEVGFTTGAASIAGGGGAGGDVPYEFSIDTIQDLTFNSCGSGYDTWLRLLSADLATEICGCDDCGDCGVQTILDCQVNAGSYVLAVGGYSTSEGDFTVSSGCTTPVMECNSFYDGTTVNAASYTGDAAGDNLYSLSITETTHIVLDSCASGYDTWLGIHHDTVDGAVACSCDDCGDCGLQTVLTCTLLAGNYIVSVGGFSSSSGAYQVTTSCTTF